jgi:hypothetical protein
VLITYDVGYCLPTGREISGKIKKALVSGQPAPDFADAQSGYALLDPTYEGPRRRGKSDATIH